MKALEFSSLASQELRSTRNAKANVDDDNDGATIRIMEDDSKQDLPEPLVQQQPKLHTKSSECVSLPTEQAPNFQGWQNMEVN